LLVAGMLANMTVWQAAREAADRDFGVVVVMDCCASETLAWHGALRTGIVGGLIRQRSSREVSQMLEGVRT
jgi:nicotinamidase-related amidase